jgi:mannose-6-phosphate isomerase-like protein (cupin superfamily)
VSAFTKVNLMELDNMLEGRGGGVDIRFGRKHLDSEQLGVTYERYDAGVRSSMGHHHEVQEEAYVVVGGSGRARLGDEIVELSKWDVLRVAPSTVRGFEAGDDGLELIAIGGDKPEGGDGVMVKDWWTD